MAYVHQEYPKMLYHPTLAPDGKVFQSAKETEGFAAKGWVETPAKFPAPLQRTLPQAHEEFNAAEQQYRYWSAAGRAAGDPMKFQEVTARYQAAKDSLDFLLRQAAATGLQSAKAAAYGELVFISCGQYTQEEISLGQSLAQIVSELTPYKGYFAQNQSSLEGLSRHIFGALNACVGFVAVMHHRGTVQTPQGPHTRASVWVEQEIAIAAFLAQAQGRQLPVVLYLHKGIGLEGVRQQLILNPVPFTDNAEVIEDFRARVKSLLPLREQVASGQ